MVRKKLHQLSITTLTIKYRRAVRKRQCLLDQYAKRFDEIYSEDQERSMRNEINYLNQWINRLNNLLRIKQELQSIL